MPQRSATYDEVLAMGDGDIKRGMEVFMSQSHAEICECVPRIKYESDLASAKKWGEHYQSLFERADKEANWNKARMFDSWTVIRQQNKGMQRMARKIKALKARLATGADLDRIRELGAALDDYGNMLAKLQPNRPVLVKCPKCDRMMPECAGEVPCYYQEKPA